MYVLTRKNEYGVEVSEHICDTCKKGFSVTPAATTEQFGGNCLAVECDSYDPDRDVDKWFK